MIHPMYPSRNEGAVHLWATLQKALPDVREQRLAFLLFNCGFRPREIVSHYPQEYCDMQEIYRLRRNIFEQYLHDGA